MSMQVVSSQFASLKITAFFLVLCDTTGIREHGKIKEAKKGERLKRGRGEGKKRGRVLRPVKSRGPRRGDDIGLLTHLILLQSCRQRSHYKFKMSSSKMEVDRCLG